jgi:poly(A) polymerase
MKKLLFEQPTIRALAERFHDAGYELYIVGGAVRDLLLNRAISDWDCATDARPEQIEDLLHEINADHIADIGKKYGTIQAQWRGLKVEVTTYRDHEVYRPGSRHPTVAFGSSLQEDLARRDFTINAMALDPLTGLLIDPFEGNADLNHRYIVAVGKAEERFAEDPLRILRAARFAAQLRFHISSSTDSAMTQMAATLTNVSMERIRDELMKILVSRSPFTGFSCLNYTGLLPYVLPEIVPLQGLSQKPHHRDDVYYHTLQVIDNVAERPMLRLAALLHDIGKAPTHTAKYDGDTRTDHFYGHEHVGAQMARAIMERLRFSRRETEYVSRLVQLHMRPHAYTSDWSSKAVKHLYVDAGECINDLLDLALADSTSDRFEAPEAVLDRLDHLRERLKQVHHEAFIHPIESPLDGNQLKEHFQRPGGPWIKDVKLYLRGCVLDGSLQSGDTEKAYELARKYLNMVVVSGATRDISVYQERQEICSNDHHHRLSRNLAGYFACLRNRWLAHTSTRQSCPRI